MKAKLSSLLIILLLLLVFTACAADDNASPVDKETVGTWDATPKVLTTKIGDTNKVTSEVGFIDASFANDGYITVEYVGTNPKVRLQITDSGGVTYTYAITNKQDVFPLTEGDGTYNVALYENISDNEYAQVLSHEFAVSLNSEFSPFLYPNKFVNFTEQSIYIAQTPEIIKAANNDIEVVSLVYEYVVNSLEYDYEKAETVEQEYFPDIDRTYGEKMGICFDYSSVMASMLRSQGIPTRLDVGYTGTIYHAWISVYLSDYGWVNGLIELSGSDWELLDPTNASITAHSGEFMDFFNVKSNYELMYKY